MLTLNPEWAPLVAGWSLFYGLPICFISSVIRGTVSPYLPFISDVGSESPESGIFSLCLYISATAGVLTVIFRYLSLEAAVIGKENAENVRTLNNITFFAGFIYNCGLIMVAAYPISSNLWGHFLGAALLFSGGTWYGTLQTVVSFWVQPKLNSSEICRTRLQLVFVNATACLLFAGCGAMGLRVWSGTIIEVAHKIPSQNGFWWFLFSSLGEWTETYSLVLWYKTMAKEFKDIKFNIAIKLPMEETKIKK